MGEIGTRAAEIYLHLRAVASQSETCTFVLLSLQTVIEKSGIGLENRPARKDRERLCPSSEGNVKVPRIHSIGVHD